MLALYKNIRQRRIELGITQKELSERLGYKSVSTIAKIEAGKSDLPQSKIKAFADALSTSVDVLMDDAVPEGSVAIPDPPATGRDILKALCKDSPQALALIDKMQVTESGEVTISGVDFTSAEIIGHALRGVLVALTRAKKTDDGNMEVVISLDAIFPPRDGGSR